MSYYHHDAKQFSDPEIYEEESEGLQIWEDEYGDAISKSAKQAMLRKKIEERLEQKRMRRELDDYDEEIYQEFDWGD